MYDWPKRKKQRLENYDYSQNGFYFVTICTKNRENYFGEIENEKINLNECWKIAESVLLNLPEYYKNCHIDEYVFMPNHFHGIITMNNFRNGFKPFPTNNRNCTKIHWLSEIIRSFKTFSSRNINNFQKAVWFR